MPHPARPAAWLPCAPTSSGLAKCRTRWTASFTAIARADLFVSIGTSGAVYPAAGFVQQAGSSGARTLELNLERSQGSGWFDKTRLGPASVLVPEWVAEVLAA